MIILDTHVWVWWVEDLEQLSEAQREAIEDKERDDNIGICARSLWEIAKLVEYGRLNLSYDLPDWFSIALASPGVHILGLTPAIAIQ
jgi:PIN domain nuclease of toxin-antitoxin system